MKYKKQFTLILLFLFFWSLYLITSTINSNRTEYHKLNSKIDSLINFNPVFSIFYTLYILEVLIIFLVFFKKEKILY